jgi:hypothetical protein
MAETILEHSRIVRRREKRLKKVMLMLAVLAMVLAAALPALAKGKG